MKPSYSMAFVERRSELMAELFLQQLNPISLVRSTHDLGYDFLVTFKNRRGGTNTFGVEVKGVDSNVPSSFMVNKVLYNRLVLSNIPSFLLVADVKRNKLFYGWPDPGDRRVPLHEVHDQGASELRKRLLDWS